MPLYQNTAVSPYNMGAPISAATSTNGTMSANDPNWGNLIGTGISSLVNYFGNNSATNSLVNGEQGAINTQLGTQNQLANIYGPQRATGNAAFGSLGSQLGLNGTPDYTPFYSSPGYQFAVSQGDQAIQRQTAANGSLYTPNELAMLSNYNTGYASQNYNNYIGQLMQAAGLGAQGNANYGQGVLSTGSNISQLQQNQGNARAGGTANSSGITSNLLNQVPWRNIGNQILGGSSDVMGVSGANDAASMASGWAAPAIDQTGVYAGLDATTGIDTASTASDIAASNADWLSGFSSAGGQAAGAGLEAGAGAGAGAAGSGVAGAATADAGTIGGLGGSAGAAGGSGGAAGASAGLAGAGYAAGALGALYGLYLWDQSAGQMTPAMQYADLANNPQMASQQTQQLQQAISSGKAVMGPNGQYTINGIPASIYYPLAGASNSQIAQANSPLIQNFLNDNGNDWSLTNIGNTGGSLRGGAGNHSTNLA